MRKNFSWVMVLALLACSCNLGLNAVIVPTASPTVDLSTPTVRPPTKTPQPTPTITLSPTPVEFPPDEPAGCREPSQDYTLVQVSGWTLNQRTASMLEYAAELMHEEPDFFIQRLTQGSYHDNGSASWGTHLGGGAVDLSVMLPGTYQVDAARLNRMVGALRTAGFAVWLRDQNELYPESAIHMHAIAIGDAQLSAPALAQLISPEGYFNGMAGLPKERGGPQPDRHGPPVICSWMLAYGAAQTPSEETSRPWRERLQTAAMQFLTNTQGELEVLTASIPFYSGTKRGPLDLDGVLAIKMLRGAGLLPLEDAADFHFSNFRLSQLNSDWRFWSIFNEDLFDKIVLPDNAQTQDFDQMPLQAGDVLLLSHGDTYYHILPVVQTDAEGKVWTVTPLRDADGIIRVQPRVLYQKGDTNRGLFYSEEYDFRWAKITILRLKGLTLRKGDSYSYQVQAGDTLARLAQRFDSSVAAIYEANPTLWQEPLQVGESILIPVNFTQ